MIDRMWWLANQCASFLSTQGEAAQAKDGRDEIQQRPLLATNLAVLSFLSLHARICPLLWLDAGVEVWVVLQLRDLGHDNSMHAISYLPPFV
jgi:hypothetical protein